MIDHRKRFDGEMIALLNWFRSQMIDHRKRFDGEMIALMTGKPVWRGDDRQTVSNDQSSDREINSEERSSPCQTVSDDRSSDREINSDEQSSDRQNDVDGWASPDCKCSVAFKILMKRQNPPNWESSRIISFREKSAILCHLYHNNAHNWLLNRSFLILQ